MTRLAIEWTVLLIVLLAFAYAMSLFTTRPAHSAQAEMGVSATIIQCGDSWEAGCLAGKDACCPYINTQSGPEDNPTTSGQEPDMIEYGLVENPTGPDHPTMIYHYE